VSVIGATARSAPSAAIANAVRDALAALGVDVNGSPITPPRHRGDPKGAGGDIKFMTGARVGSSVKRNPPFRPEDDGLTLPNPRLATRFRICSSCLIDARRAHQPPGRNARLMKMAVSVTP